VTTNAWTQTHTKTIAYGKWNYPRFIYITWGLQALLVVRLHLFKPILNPISISFSIRSDVCLVYVRVYPSLLRGNKCTEREERKEKRGGECNTLHFVACFVLISRWFSLFVVTCAIYHPLSKQVPTICP